MKAKIEELETNSNIKNIRDLYRGINDFKWGYQPTANIVKDDKGDLVANDVRQTEIHTAEPLVPEPSASEFELGRG